MTTVPAEDPGEDPLVPGTAAAEVVGLLAGRGETLAAAESLTAGLLTATLAGVPGASTVLRGGLVVYATDLKDALAGVPGRLLAEQGPVAADTARALAEGALRRCGAHWGVGLTGVAGPTEQDGHPVGTVFLGLAYGNGPSGRVSSRVRRLELSGSRWRIRREAVVAALAAVRETAAGAPGPAGLAP